MQQVGKYQLIRKLATGGMAEVFLAKAAGPMGFEKTLVLKRILPHLAEEPAFVEMFLSEAKLAARLTHPNIVQIFDFGEADGAYFLAMEYIDGPSLRTLVKRASAQGLSLPLAACARLVAHACEGLAFAHDFVDPQTGVPLGLIHRDISPDNILLSRQGAVKVVDFGIAKAAGQGHKTESGVIKGKLAYMPPEQVRAESLDRRVDVYALGVVLYELLTAHKPFEADSEIGLMRAILTQSPMPAVQFRPELPDSLRRILGRALAKDREQRYPDCHAFQSDLEEFILSVGKPVTTQQVAQLIARVSPNTDNSTPTPRPGLPPGGSNPSVSPGHTPSSPDAKTDTERPTVLDIRPLPRATPPSGQMATRIQRTPVKPQPQPQPRGRWVQVLVAGVLLMAGGGVVLWRTASSRSAPQKPTHMAQREPPPVTSPSAEPLPATSPSAELPPSPAPELSTNSPGAQPQEQADGGVATVLQGAPAVPEGSPSAPTTPSPEVSSLKPGEQEPVSPKPTPQKAGTSRTERPSLGGVPAKPKRAPKKGTLEIRVRPYAIVFLSGKKIGETPMSPVELPPGIYTVKLVNENLKREVTMSVEVKPGEPTVLPVNLFKE
jgi:serine/threonine-protein kinase